MLIIINDKYVGRRLKYLFLRDTFTAVATDYWQVSNELQDYVRNRFAINIGRVYIRQAAFIGEVVEMFGVLRLCTEMARPDGYIDWTDDELRERFTGYYHREEALFVSFPADGAPYRLGDPGDREEYIIRESDHAAFACDANEVPYDHPGVPFDLSRAYSDWDEQLLTELDLMPGISYDSLYEIITDVVNAYHANNRG